MKNVMLAMVVLGAVGCGGGSDPAEKFLGKWSYTGGGGHFSCDDGQGGTLDITAGFVFGFSENADTGDLTMDLITDCSVGMQVVNGVMVPGDVSVCTYNRVDPQFGAYSTKIEYLSDSTWTLDADNLSESSHATYSFDYTDIDYKFVCDVTTEAAAVRN